MVGGYVIEALPMTRIVGEYPGASQDVVRVWCVDRNTDEAAIYVAAPEGLRIRPGDQVWWQGRTAFWTPQDGSAVDVPMGRVGFSFDPRAPANSREDV